MTTKQRPIEDTTARDTGSTQSKVRLHGPTRSRTLKMLTGMKTEIPSGVWEWYENSWAVPPPECFTRSDNPVKTKEGKTTYKDWHVTTIIEPLFNIPLGKRGEDISDRYTIYTLPTKLSADVSHALKSVLENKSGIFNSTDDIERSVNSELGLAMERVAEMSDSQVARFASMPGLAESFTNRPQNVSSGMKHLHQHRVIWTVHFAEGWEPTPENGVFPDDGWYRYDDSVEG